jgi:hypothetical protein
MNRVYNVSHKTESIGTIEVQQQEIQKLQAKLDKAREALDEIVYPIKHMQDKAEKEGMRLDGGIAIALGENASYLKNIAIKALTEIEGSEDR